MAVSVDPGLVAYLRRHSGNFTVIVRGEPVALVASALDAARRAIARIRHPDEPEEPYASFVSEPAAVDDGWRLTADMADAEAYDGLLEAVVATVVGALEEQGVSWAVVSFPPTAGVGADGARPGTGPGTRGRPRRDPRGVPAAARRPACRGGDRQQPARVNQFVVNEPCEDLVGFYRAALTAGGYAVTGVTEGTFGVALRSGHVVDFQGPGLHGALWLAEWADPSPTFGFGTVRVDIWTQR